MTTLHYQQLGDPIPPMGVNEEDMDTKLSSSKELGVPKSSLYEINGIHETISFMNLDTSPPNLLLVFVDPSFRDSQEITTRNGKKGIIDNYLLKDKK